MVNGRLGYESFSTSGDGRSLTELRALKDLAKLPVSDTSLNTLPYNQKNAGKFPSQPQLALDNPGQSMF